MKILQISIGEIKLPVQQGGGVEAYIMRISEHIVNKGFSVTVVDRKYSIDDPNADYISGVKIVRLKAKRFNTFSSNINFILNQLCLAFKIKKYITENNFDVIHIHNSIIGLILLIITPNIKSKLYYTSHTTRRLKEILSSVDKIAIFLENQLVKYSKKTIVLCEEIKDKLIVASKVKPQDIYVIPVSINLDKYNFGFTTNKVLQTYGIRGTFTILFVGRLCVDKGIEYLVKAANLVINEMCYNNIVFVLVGPVERFGIAQNKQSTYINKIQELIHFYKLQNNLIFTGVVSPNELLNLFSACDIFVLPSLTEAMPTVILEAMASGKPVIGTKVGGVPIQVKNGRNGLLIDPADHTQLANAIKFFLDNPSELTKMGMHGRNIVEEEFSTEKIVQKLIEAYNSQ